MLNVNTILLISEFEKFVHRSVKKRRQSQRNSSISSSSIDSYKAVAKNLAMFEAHLQERLEIPLLKGRSKREQAKVKAFWLRFQRDFTGFLLKQGYLDNYIGLHFKVLRTFLNWSQAERQLHIGDYHKKFQIRKEETPIITISSEQLQQLLFDRVLLSSLPVHLSRTRDLFLFGCFTGLRYSDLEQLSSRNLELRNGATYLLNTSKKTGTNTRIKLPQPALDILSAYPIKQKKLLPYPSKNQFNKNLKSLGEKAGWVWEVGKERTRNGRKVMLKKADGKQYRFCDLLSSHVMRKTAITILLMNGMPEHMVRKVSGHAANSREFYRYVNYSQSFVDAETDKVFDKVSKQPILSESTFDSK